jgi:predicted phosphodiesterase
VSATTLQQALLAGCADSVARIEVLGVKRAIISDIHSNLEAFEAVLQDIRAQGITEIYCLGDIIGYGPNPRECIDLVMQCNVTLLGNHDQGALFDPEGFNTGAERAIFWTREQLESPRGDPEQNARRWEFLGELPRNRREEGLLFVHGSARNPLNEYVFPEDIYNDRKMQNIFGLIERYCFQGHTHVPGVFVQGGAFTFNSPDEIDYRFRLGDEKTMVNVGSVGQPRDGDRRACYVVLEDVAGSNGSKTYDVNFRRVEYPFEQTIEKIYKISDLDNFLGDRLREGK